MARKKVIPKRDIIEKVRQDIAKEQESHEAPATLDLVKHAGGSINNLPVKTEEFKQWLDDHQKINPFIGKHAHYSQEDSAEEVQLDDREELTGKKAAKCLRLAEEGSKEFDPNSSFGEKAKSLGAALKGDDNHDKKFIDITIAENMTHKLLNRPEEEIVEEAKKAMKIYHDDDKYETPINVSRIVEESKILFIEENLSSKKLLK